MFMKSREGQVFSNRRRKSSFRRRCRRGLEALEDRRLLATTHLSDFGTGVGDDLDIDVSAALEGGDPVDSYTFVLEPGDIFGANVDDNADTLEFFDPDDDLLIESDFDIGVVPDAIADGTLLPYGGNANAWYVVSESGTYQLDVSGPTGDYDLELRVYRPELERQAIGNVQYLYLDFDGETIDADAIFGSGNTNASLDGIDDFLTDWGLVAGDEDDVIDAIIDVVEENFDDLKKQLKFFADVLMKKKFDSTLKMDLPDDPLLIRADMWTEMHYIAKIMQACGDGSILIWRVELAVGENEDKVRAREQGK